MTKTYYSVGTNIVREASPEAEIIAKGIEWLVAQRNSNGTWGSSDALDTLIATNHAIMALFSIGCSPESPILAPAIEYLINLDTDKNITFFWRAGTLLNLPKFDSVITHDMEYIWSFRNRIGVHKDYPVPFYLLKLLKFSDKKYTLSFNLNDVLRWVLEEWQEKDCWYGRTSITSMALALIYDMKFKNKTHVVDRCIEFLLSQFKDEGATGFFHENLVDDAFTVFNLSESGFLASSKGLLLAEKIEKCVTRLTAHASASGVWASPPPFGGSVGPNIYPTAVMIRALIAYHSRNMTHFQMQVSASVLEKLLAYDKTVNKVLKPFWGELSSTVINDTCFVLMPFTPTKLTEIYKRYIKTPIELEFNLKCLRADDIYKPTSIMLDIWEHLNSSRIIIADLTNKNANVFYELGMAHVLGKPVILICQRVEDVPFDLRGVRVLFYDDGPEGYDNLAVKIVQYVQDILKSI